MDYIYKKVKPNARRDKNAKIMSLVILVLGISTIVAAVLAR